MSSFTPPRDRDAWNTIRGYVYQVDLTIERWLKLQPGQTLELECGEDIDIVSRSLTATPEEQDRLLEQVKHRESVITLRTPEVITAIACFIEHCQTNPSANLLFRFTTNTQVGKEKPSPIPKKIPGITDWKQIPGITAWKQIHQGHLQQTALLEVLKGIRIILNKVQKPDKLHNDTWQIFREFITTASDEQLLDLIRNFEWSTNAPQAQSLSPILQKLLLERQYATDNLQAQEQYQRLFLYVFKLLSQRGSKQLTVNELTQQLSLPTLSESDRDLLNNLWVWVQAIESRVSTLEQGLSQTNQAITLIDAEVQRLAREQGINASIRYTVSTPILDIPPSVKHLSNRVETVNILLGLFNNHTWVAIHGGAGTGKKQLAILVVHARDVAALWLSLRGLTIEQACLQLDIAWEALMASSSQMIVLYDIPRLLKGDKLSERLLRLANLCRGKNIYILSTSCYEFPLSLREYFDDHTLHVIEAPLFSNQEAYEILLAYGASPSVLNTKFVNFINNLARQIPWLITAIARYLHQQNWQFTDEVLTGLFKSEYTAELNNEIIDRLLVTIEEPETRELLYRLNLVQRDFNREDIQAIASVEPIVERYPERLNALMGLWVQRNTNNRFLVSPLVKALGSDNLLSETRKVCHLRLGERFIHQNRQYNQYDAIDALIHFYNAEAFNKAGTILILALYELDKIDELVDDGGLLLLWCNQPLPEQMDLGLRIYVRGLQVAVGHKYNLNTTYLVQNLDRLLEQASEKEAWAVIGSVTLVNRVLSQSDPVRANHYLLTGLQLLPNGQKPDGSKLVFTSEVRWEWLLWGNIRGITTAEHLQSWVSTIEYLTPEQRQSVFTSAPAELGCLLVSEKLWLQEADKPREQQQWQTLLVTFRELAETAFQLNLELLWACAIRAQIVVLAEYCHDLNAAVTVAEEAIATASDDPRVQFLIKECVGRQYLYVNRNDEAVAYLEKALNQSIQAYPFVRMHALLSASRAIASQEPYLAIQYTQQAVNLAQTFEEIPETELVKALGELAIAKWLASDLVAAFEPWEQAGEHLFACKTDADAWKTLLTVYAHISVYFTTLAITGSPPTLDGQPYSAPQRGIFLTSRSEIVANYDPSRDSLLTAQLAQFAEAIGNDERAATWALKGMDMARTANQYLAFPSLSINAIPHLLLDNRYAEVLDLAVEAGTILMANVLHTQSGGNPLDSNLDVAGILGSHPNEMWRQAERNAFIMGLLPITFCLSTVAIRQPEIARRLAADVAGLCREISETSDEQTHWITAAEIIEQIHLQQVSCNELIHRYQTLNSQSNVLQAIGYLAATLQEGTTLAKTLEVHLAIMPLVYGLLKPGSTIYRRIILPFITTYWKKAFEQVYFRFNSPQLVSQMFFQAQNLCEEQQAQLILGTVAYSLGVSLPPEAVQWLREQFSEPPV